MGRGLLPIGAVSARAWGLIAAIAMFACAPDVEEAPRFLTRLDTAADLATVTSTAGGDVRYLAPVAGRAKVPSLDADCYFQNMQRYTWHLEFLRSFPAHAGLSYDAYLGLVLRASTRTLWGGAIEARASGVVSYTIYGDPGSVDVAAIVAVDRRLKSCAALPLVFAPSDPAQRGVVMSEGSSLESQGVDWAFPENL